MNSTSAFLTQYEVLSTLTSKFASAFQNSNIFSKNPITVLGNNDLYPKYSAPYATPVWLNNWLDLWPALNYSANTTVFQNNGCFRVDINITGGNILRILGLNTNYWSASNKNTGTTQDPAGIFAWLGSELQLAQSIGIKVFIVGHIPPGIDHFALVPQYYQQFVSSYLNVTDPYINGTIVKQFFGHEHVMLFRIYSASAVPIELISSISLYYNNNPTYRIYSYDTTTFETLDYEEWYYIVNGTNSMWAQQFQSVKALYGLNSLDSNAMCSFLANMDVNSKLFQTYYSNSQSFTPLLTPCNVGYCENTYLCNAQQLFFAQWSACVNATNVIECAYTPSSTSSAVTSPETTMGTSSGNRRTETLLFSFLCILLFLTC